MIIMTEIGKLEAARPGDDVKILCSACDVISLHYYKYCWRSFYRRQFLLKRKLKPRICENTIEICRIQWQRELFDASTIVQGKT